MWQFCVYKLNERILQNSKPLPYVTVGLTMKILYPFVCLGVLATMERILHVCLVECACCKNEEDSPMGVKSSHFSWLGRIHSTKIFRCTGDKHNTSWYSSIISPLEHVCLVECKCCKNEDFIPVSSFCLNCIGRHSPYRQKKRKDVCSLTMAASKTYNFSPVGMWTVFGPTSPLSSLFTILILAKVPLAMTSSFPRRLP